uniref:Uncharacterized protein n=1 Tax=Plectus sambesii TaxID=2011161 RepID=A0A914VKA0_9BILA
MYTTIKLIAFVAFICVMIDCSCALQCNSGTDRGATPLRKANYPHIYKCCYKYADVSSSRRAVFGAVPPSLTKRACTEIGKCFYSIELHKNVCVCADADDSNCQPGPIKLTQSTSTPNYA